MRFAPEIANPTDNNVMYIKYIGMQTAARQQGGDWRS